MDNAGKDLKEKNIDFTRIGEATRNSEVWRSLVEPYRQLDDGGAKRGRLYISL